MNEFIKNGNKVFTRPNGSDYTLELGSTYVLKYDSWGGYGYLEVSNKIKLPENYFCSNTDKKFISKVLNYFKTNKKSTTGVMLTGLKGSGKTVTSKKIAIDSKLPIIIVDTQFPAKRLQDFFDKFTQEVVVVFDEVEKNKDRWNSEDLLNFLDGISNTCRKIVIFTCNSDEKLCDFIKDRCSRVRYWKQFNELPEADIYELCLRELKDENKASSLTSFITQNFKTISFDNVLSFVEELKMDENCSYEELLNDLNIHKK